MPYIALAKKACTGKTQFLSEVLLRVVHSCRCSQSVCQLRVNSLDKHIGLPLLPLHCTHCTGEYVAVGRKGDTVHGPEWPQVLLEVDSSVSQFILISSTYIGLPLLPLLFGVQHNHVIVSSRGNILGYHTVEPRLSGHFGSRGWPDN